MPEIPRPDSEQEPADAPLPADAATGNTSPAGAGSTDKQSQEEEVLRELGEYRLLEKLGEGGMGAVYKARHTRLDRIVAVKVLPTRYAEDEQVVARFDREMRAVGGLVHPHIVQAYDAREIAGTRLLVMEYVDGCDLARVIERCGPLAVAEACELVRQGALGLQAAHEHGLIHRDIKPSNLMLTCQGQVKLMDLGLARFQSEPTGEELTDRDQIMGTADYMAPEQVSNSHDVDIRADIYGLGCTLYKLLAGEAPFSGPQFKGRFDKMVAHVLRPPTPIEQVRADVAPALGAVLRRMMAKQAADRYATPAEVAEALAPFAGGARLAELAQRSRTTGAPSDAEHSRGRTVPLCTSELSATRPDRPGAALAALDLPAAVSPPSAVEATTRRSVRRSRLRALAAALAASGLVGLMAIGVNAWFRGRQGNSVVPSAIPEQPSIALPGQQAGLTAPSPMPAGPPKPRPKSKLRRPKPSGPMPALALAPFDAKQARQHQEAWAKYLGVPVEQDNSIGMKLVLIPPGEFDMGLNPPGAAPARAEGKPKGAQHPAEKPAARRGASDPAEKPLCRVRITRPFLLGAYEVTQAEYQRLMGADPSHFRKPGAQAGKEAGRYPVESVPWSEAVTFCQRLSDLPEEQSGGRQYRLPTEAQWEYACRAGTTTVWYSGDQETSLAECAWFMPQSGETTHPVGQKRANAWGLYDMLGNVFEWCADWHAPQYDPQQPRDDPAGPATGSERVIRGGSWWNYAAHCRSGFRVGAPADGSHLIGLRVACDLGAAEE